MRAGRITPRALFLGGLMMAAACMDVAGPHARGRVALGLYPVFDTRAGGPAGDADSFVIVIQNPPFADDTIARRIDPGQDTIQIIVQTDVSSAGADTIGITFDGYCAQCQPVLHLYSGSTSITVFGSAPAQSAPVPASYVGPGGNIASLTLAPHALTLSPGGTAPLAISATDSTGAPMPDSLVPVVFITHNVNVAAVSRSGVVTAVANGSTWVIAQSVAHANIRDSASVTVQAAAPPAIGLSAASASFTDTIGSPNPPNQAITISNTGGASLAGLAVGTIAYGAGGSGWLNASLSGTTAPATLTLAVNPSGLGAGHYTAQVPVTATGASNSPQTVTVSLDVVGTPAIALSAASLTFTDTIGLADPASQSVTVTNSGTGTLANLTVGTISYGAGSGWITSAVLSGGTAPATLTVLVNPSGLAAGHYTATIPVQSNLATNSPQSVAVSFDVLNPPLGSITITPGWFVMLPTGGRSLVVTAKSTIGTTLATPALTWTSRNPSVATVNASGSVTGVAGGTTVIVADAGNGIADSTLVAVAGSGQAIASAIADSAGFDRVKAGDTVRVLVAVDLRNVSGGNVGSYTAEVDWNTSQLTFISADTVSGGFASPTINTNNTAAGQLKFGAANPNGYTGPQVALLQVTFRASSAGSTPVTFLLTDLTEAGTFTNLLTQAIIVSSAVAVQ